MSRFSPRYVARMTRPIHLITGSRAEFNVGTTFDASTRQLLRTGGVGMLYPGRIIAQAAEKKFGKDHIRYDCYPAKSSAPSFPVLRYDGNVESSLARSQVLARMPEIEIDNVYCDKSIFDDAIKWRNQEKKNLLGVQ